MKNNFEIYLNECIEKHANNEIVEAMKYCMEGGKRFRPKIIFSIVKGFGLKEEDAYPFAAALEFIQTYSLIHDDLPGMDNDDYRRGKLSCHKKFGEDIAILTGDAFLNHSFEIICDSNYSDTLKVNLIKILSKYSGLEGMIYGQLLDLRTKEINKESLFNIQDNKTSGLFKICCLGAMYICNNDNYEYFEKLGSKLGIVFQNQDDLFDITKTFEETGKTASDIRNDKLTALKFLNIEELKENIKFLFNELYEYLKVAPFSTIELEEIIRKIELR